MPPSQIDVGCRSRIKDQVSMTVADNLVVTKNSSKQVFPNFLHVGMGTKELLLMDRERSSLNPGSQSRRKSALDASADAASDQLPSPVTPGFRLATLDDIKRLSRKKKEKANFHS